MTAPTRIRLEDHPTVRQSRKTRAQGKTLEPPAVLDPVWLRELCLECGADDVGFVSLERPELAEQRGDILAAFPHARSVISSGLTQESEKEEKGSEVGSAYIHRAGFV